MTAALRVAFFAMMKMAAAPLIQHAELPQHFSKKIRVRLYRNFRQSDPLLFRPAVAVPPTPLAELYPAVPAILLGCVMPGLLQEAVLPIPLSERLMFQPRR
jgi:hypothetical protein